MRHLLSVLIFAALTTLLNAQNELPNTYCPVTPSDLSEPDIHAVYKGQTIYFCCKSCLRDFNKDPESYLANLDSKTSVKNEPSGSQSHSETETKAHLLGTEQRVIDDHDHDHDHSDHGEGLPAILVLLGKLHVVVIHFPIALIAFAAFAQVGQKITGRDSLALTADLAFQAGTVPAIAAAVMGWIAASQSSYPENFADTLSNHRWLGTIVAALSTLASIWLLIRKNIPYKAVVYTTLAVLVLVTAHFGGSLIYGPDYF